MTKELFIKNIPAGILGIAYKKNERKHIYTRYILTLYKKKNSININ